MRMLQLDSLSPEGITQGRADFLAHTDGGIVVSAEQWYNDYDDDGEPAPAIFTAIANLDENAARTLKAWINEVVK